MARLSESINTVLQLPTVLPAEEKEITSKLQRLEGSLIEEILRTRKMLNGDVEFGYVDIESNMRGTWVSHTFAARATANVVVHNMNLPVAGAAIPNVRWIIMMIDASAAQTGVTGDSTISVSYEGGTVLADSIELELFADPSRTVGAGDEVVVDFFMFPVGT